MSKQFLYEQLDSVSKMGFLNKEMPDFLAENLNPNFSLREYQKEAFARFFHCFNGEYEDKEYPVHLLFNMATGSGKTLIMAGLILYLYEQGYRNFLFFVNSANIIEKTRDNFLNDLSGKYLFDRKINFNNRRVYIKEVDNFDGVNENDINIRFTTIQKLHSDLHNEKENSLTFDDFRDKKIALIADEAHHGQVRTKNKTKEMWEKPNWENTVEKIFKQNSRNLLLEFTATMDFFDKNIIEKYKNKVIYKYELKEFRNDGYSKDVELFHSDTDKKGRIIQAIILSQYRQEVAGKYGLNLKPVILFKAQKTIAQSEENKELFHKIIDELSVGDVAEIGKKSNAMVLGKAFEFFKQNKISDSLLVKKLKDGFAENKTLSVNEEKEKEKHQLLLNSLEDKNNKIRAIFAVQKLNEGWDVLNLFDIVRLYETRDGKAGKPGKTTISEAQLIGRGARYWPFDSPVSPLVKGGGEEGVAIAEGEGEDKYKRKYDKDLENELRILEELHYHSHNEHRYISEIKTALVEEGMIDEDETELDLKLKKEFRNSKFFKSGLIYVNEKRKRNFEKVKELSDLGVSRKNMVFKILSGAGKETQVFEDFKNSQEAEVSVNKKTSKDVFVKNIESHIIENALAKNEFYNFNSLKKYFPRLNSKREFFEKEEYLAGFSITFEGLSEEIENLSNENKFLALCDLLEKIEIEIKGNLTEYEGSEEFLPAQISRRITDKKIKIKKGSERAEGQEDFLADKDWYVFNANYGTEQEKNFVKLIDRQINELKKEFEKIYLVRNERQVKIYNFRDGRAFEPDFLLFLTDKKGEGITYQLFLEPKGPQLAGSEKWKADFLEEIKEKFGKKIWEFAKDKKYKIIGLPFYEAEMENEFKEKLFESIK